MGFSVDIAALGGLAPALDRRERDMDAGRAYLRHNTALEYGPGLLNLLRAGHSAVIDEVDGFLRDGAAATAAGYAIRIRRALAAYRGCDLTAAARGDAALAPARVGGSAAAADTSAASPPDGSGTGAEEGGRGAGTAGGGWMAGGGWDGPPAGDPAPGPELFDDPLRPAEHYRPPVDRHDLFPYQPQWTDVFSPTGLARDAVWLVTSAAAGFGLLDRPLDPYEALVAPLCGDWAGLYACGDVMEGIAAALTDTATVLDCSAVATGRAWTGLAASGCTQGLRHFATTLGGASAVLLDIGAMYREVARGVHANAELLGEVITALLDQAIGVAAALGSNGALAPVAAASELRDVVVIVRRALRLIAGAEQVVRDADAALTSLSNRFGIIGTGHSLPGRVAGYPPMPQPATARFG